MGDMFSDVKFRMMKKGLDNAASQHRLVTNNIANLETPGFKGKRLVFDDILNNTEQMKSGGGLELTRTNARHLPLVASNGDTDARTVTLNKMNMDEEMAELAKSDLTYNTLIETLTREHGFLKDAIRGGK